MSKQQNVAELPVVINQPGGKWGFPDFQEMWQYRELLVHMIYSELKSRYKQTIMGFLWAVLSPLITVAVYTLVFNRLVGIETEIPYAIFAFSGLLIWSFFMRGLIASSSSIVTYNNVIGKIYFPRIFGPMSRLLVGLVDFIVALVVLIILMALFGYIPGLRSIGILYFLTLTLMTALGAGLWLSALNVRFRDINFVLPYIMQTMQFLTPVIYPSDLLSEPWRTLYAINPMVTACDGFRWALLNYDNFHVPGAIVSTIVALTLFVSGLIFFHRLEKSFPDLI